jgi:DNA polymerase-3 subunit gamma/tau
MAHQSLYRRYRPQRFGEVRGQDHLVRALRNAVAEDRVGHAYLFSGPRGTGKTTTARILAKALNCEELVDGEPCGTCDSCTTIAEGRSFDVFELDAASNNGVDAIRDLVDRASQSSPGRTKVYILDEVHMLSTAASNALLKTLEEPPDHVVFVLATTDPQKVLPTIKSRTQHYEVHLLPGEDLSALVDDIAERAELDVSDEARSWALRAGGGSARDTLSALDRVVAFGGVPEEADSIDDLIDAIAGHDVGAALLAVEGEVTRGRAPRTIGEDLIARLRDVFLAALGTDVGRHGPDDAERIAAQAQQMGPRGATRALEILGDAFVGIQDAPDPRVTLEVALVRMTRSDAAESSEDGDLARRVASLEQVIASGGTDAGGAPASKSHARTAPSAAPAPSTADDRAGPPTSAGTGAADAARRVLAERRTKASGGERRSPADQPDPPAAAPPDAAAPTTPAAPEAQEQIESDTPTPTTASAGTIPDRDALTLAWGDVVLDSLPQKAKARFGGGRFVDSDDTGAVFALPNEHHRRRCEELRPVVEEALAAHFCRPVPMRVIAEASAESAGPSGGAGAGQAATPPELDDDHEAFDPDDLVDADETPVAGADLVRQAFPGTEEVESGT